MRRPARAMLVALLLATSLVPATSAQSPDPSPAASPAASASPVPNPAWPDAAVPGAGGLTPGVLDWQPADIPSLGEGREYSDLTAWADGFAVIERKDDEDTGRSLAPAIWTSADGLAWTRHRLPGEVRFQGVIALLALKQGLVIVSNVPRPPDAPWPGHGFDHTFWRSDDGATWRQAGSLSWRAPGRCQGTHSDFVSVGDALMLYQGVCWDPCCGFAPSPGSQAWAMEAARPARGDTIAWRSTDGGTWTRTSLRGVEPRSRSDHAEAFQSWPGEVLSLWKDGPNDPPRLLRSVDGVRWTPVAEFPSDVELDSLAVMAPTSDAVLLAGYAFTLEGDPSAAGNNALAWRTDGGTIGAPTIQRQPGTIEGVIRDGDTVMLMGSAGGPGSDAASEADDQAWAWIMGSTDGGRTWDPALSWTGSDGSCVGPAVQHAAIVVMHGCRRWQVEDGDAPTPAFWVATMPEP